MDVVEILGLHDKGAKGRERKEGERGIKPIQPQEPFHQTGCLKSCTVTEDKLWLANGEDSEVEGSGNKTFGRWQFGET